MQAFQISRILRLLVFTIFVASSANAQDSSVTEQLERLRRDIDTLQGFVYRGEQKTGGQGHGAGFASQDSVSQLQRQVQEIRGRMRNINGIFEEIQHNISQVSARLDKLVADVDLRLRSLEKGPPRVGQRPMAPRLSDTGATRSSTTIVSSSGTTTEQAGTAVNRLGDGRQTLGRLSKSDLQQFRDTGSVTPSKSAPATPTRKAMTPQVATAPKSVPTPAPVTAERPQSTSVSGKTSVLPDGTPKQQYEFAVNLLYKRDLPAAEIALTAFINRHPKHELADNATFWLGETHFARRNYDQAIKVYYDAYRTYPNGNKAPDILLKLGMSLSTIGEKESACSAFEELASKHPKASPRILTTAVRAKKKISCK